MKGYCPNCEKVIDEVEFTQFKMCEGCSKDVKNHEVKHTHLRIRKGNSDYYYTCKTLEWNYWLDRYYPKAVLVMTVEHLNNGFKLKVK